MLVKAMEPKPEDRYATVDAMIVDLEAYLQGQAVSAHHDTIWDLVKRLYKKDPRSKHYFTPCFKPFRNWIRINN